MYPRKTERKIHISKRPFNIFCQNLEGLKRALFESDFVENKIYLTKSQCVMIVFFNRTQERYVSISYETKTETGPSMDISRTINLSQEEFTDFIPIAEAVNEKLQNFDSDEEDVSHYGKDNDTANMTVYVLSDDECINNSIHYSEQSAKSTAEEKGDGKMNIRNMVIVRPDKSAVISKIVMKEMEKYCEENEVEIVPNIFKSIDKLAILDIISQTLVELNYNDPLETNKFFELFTFFNGEKSLFDDDSKLKQNICKDPIQDKIIVDAYKSVIKEIKNKE